MKRRFAFVFACVLLVRCASLLGGAPTSDVAIRTLELVPTFESIGACVTVDGAMEGLSAKLLYRDAASAEWRPALQPVAEVSGHQFRGSVLLVAPETRYEIKAQVWRADALVAERSEAVTTWAEDVPIARDVTLAAGVVGEPLVITDRGTPDGWIRYRAAAGGSTINPGVAAPSAVVLKNAAYVIVEGLTIRGGTKHAVHIVDSHDVRISGCDIAEWGDPGKWGFYRDAKRQQWSYLDAAGKIIDRQAGIRVHGAESRRVVLEWNLVHHPRGTANSWAFAHPHGPSGIVLSETGGNHVVRYNDLIAGDGHRWNDAIESEFNAEINGGPHRDTDLYGNLLVSANDDGTELDGGQMNVRYWQNRIEGGFCGVSCAPNRRGPSYVFRNVIVTGDERGASGAGFKMGGDQFPDPGTTFLLQNTVYTNNYGLTSGHYGKGPTPIFVRDNIFSGPAGGQGRVRYDRAVAGDLDHDLIPPDGMLGAPPQPGREAAAFFAVAQFRATEERDFRLRPKSPGVGVAEDLPNLGGGDMGAWPDPTAAGASPPRPDAPEIWPGRKVMRVRAGEIAEVSLRVSSKRSWTALGGEAWLSVTSNEARDEVRCRIDARTLEVGTHRTFVSVRDDQGRLRSIPLEIEVEPAKSIAFRFSFGAALPCDGFEPATESGTSSGRAVRVTAATKAGMEFPFETRATDEFFVLARVRATGPAAKIATQDSVTLRIDDGPPMIWDLFGLADDAWQWIAARPVESVSGRFLLQPGRHRVSIGGREPGLLLDALVVSNSPFPPIDVKR